jgi:hypothetical protein
MIKVKKTSEIKIGDEAIIVGISKHYSSYCDGMERFIDNKITVTDINVDNHIRSSKNWWYPRASYDFVGDTEPIKLNDVIPNLNVKIGKELNSLVLSSISEYSRLNKKLNTSDMIYLNAVNGNMYYNKVVKIVNDKKLYLQRCEHDTYVGLEIDGKLLYLPYYVLYKFEPNYKPKKIKRSI